MTTIQTDLSPEMQQLLEPPSWKDYANVDAVERQHYAEEAGVAAIYFMPEVVESRIGQMAQVQVARLELLEDPSSFSFVTLMDGGAPFSSKLKFAMTTLKPGIQTGPQYDLDITNYGPSQTPLLKPRVLRDVPHGSMKDMNVVFIDDLGDKWGTMRFASGHLMDDEETIGSEEYNTRMLENRLHQALGVGASVLATKGSELPNRILSHVDIGFFIPEPWGSGMGMDGPSELHRWNPALMMSSTQEFKYYKSTQDTLNTLSRVAVTDMDGIVWLGDKKDEQGHSIRVSRTHAEELYEISKLAA